MNDSKLVIDLSNIAYRSMYAVNLKTSDGKPSGHVVGFTNTMLALREKYWNSRFVFVLDSKPTRKIALYPEYKQTRKSAEYNPVGDIVRYVRLMNCDVVWCDGEEADDVMASYCENNDDKDITIVSSDSDLYQLIDKERGVRQLNPATNKYITSDDLYKKFNLEKFERVNLWKAMFGDSGDNVKPPIPRLTKKLLIPVIEACDGTVAGFFEELLGCNGNFYVFPEKMYGKISDNNFRSGLERNYELVTLKKDVDYLQKRYCGNLLWLCEVLRRFECRSLISEKIRRLV